MRLHFILSFSLLLAAGGNLSAAVDRNGNGMSDVWEMIYNASAL